MMGPFRFAAAMPAFLAVMTAPLVAHGDATQPEAEASNGPALQEIVVTAQKRQQSINDVGTSIDAFTGDTLKDVGVQSLADLNKVVAGLNVQPPGANIAGAPVYFANTSSAEYLATLPSLEARMTS